MGGGGVEVRGQGECLHPNECTNDLVVILSNSEAFRNAAC